MNYCPLRPYIKCPYSDESMSPDEKEPKEEMQWGFSFIRFIHTSPNTPALDVFLNDRKAVSNLQYASMAGYAALPSGSHRFEVYHTGQKYKVLLQFTLELAQGSYHTIMIGGLSSNIQYRIYSDSEEVIPENRSHIRFVHASPSAPSLDAALETGEKLFSSITLGRTEEYIPLEPHIYNFRIMSAGTPNILLYLPELSLRGGRAYTIYTIGMLGGSPPLTAVILSDGRR